MAGIPRIPRGHSYLLFHPPLEGMFGGLKSAQVGKLFDGLVMDCARDASTGESMDFGAHLEGTSQNEKTPVSQAFSLEKPGFSLMRAEGLEPSTQGLKVLCSTD
jgi:hypothetical protein